MDTKAKEDRLKNLKGKVLESYLLYGSGAADTFEASGETMTLGILEKVMNECDNQDYYHKFVVSNVAPNLNRHSILKRVLDFLHPTVLIPVYFRKHTNKCFFLAMNCHESVMKIIANRFKIPNPESPSNPFDILVFCNYISASTIDSQRIDNLQAVIQNRFDESKRILNLTNFILDDTLDHYYPLYISKVMLNVMSIVSAYLPVYLSLRGNNLKEVNSIYPLNKVELEGLDLSNNEISSVEDLECLKYFENLKSLTLDGNPICDKYDDFTYITTIKSLCTSLEKLDNVKLTSPPTFRKNFLCKIEAKDFAEQFMEHFFMVYDSENRESLSELYAKNAMFSVSSRIIPEQTSSDTVNLKHYGWNKPFLVYGVEEIIKVFEEFPKTYHDAYTFVCDVLTYEPTYLVLSIGGMFREGRNIMTFSRNFVVKSNNDEYLITNDQLLVQNATNIQLTWCFRFPTPGCNFPYFAGQYKAVEDCMQRLTKMNRSYCQRYLDYCQYDLKKALQLFSELHVRNEIPEDAFDMRSSELSESHLPFYERIRNKVMEVHKLVSSKTVWDVMYKERMEKWSDPITTTHRHIRKIYHFSSASENASVPGLSRKEKAKLKQSVQAKRDSEASKPIRFNIPSVLTYQEKQKITTDEAVTFSPPSKKQKTKPEESATRNNTPSSSTTKPTPPAKIKITIPLPPRTRLGTAKAPPVATPSTSRKTLNDKPVVTDNFGYVVNSSALEMIAKNKSEKNKVDLKKQEKEKEVAKQESAEQKRALLAATYQQSKIIDNKIIETVVEKQKAAVQKKVNTLQKPATSQMSPAVPQKNPVVSQKSPTVSQMNPVVSHEPLLWQPPVVLQPPILTPPPNIPHKQILTQQILTNFTDGRGLFTNPAEAAVLLQQTAIMQSPQPPMLYQNQPPSTVPPNQSYLGMNAANQMGYFPQQFPQNLMFQHPPPPMGNVVPPPPEIPFTTRAPPNFVEDDYYPCPLADDTIPPGIDLPVPPGEETTPSTDTSKAQASSSAAKDASVTGQKRKATEEPKNAPGGKQPKAVAQLETMRQECEDLLFQAANTAKKIKGLHRIELLLYHSIMNIIKSRFADWEPTWSEKGLLVEFVKEIHSFIKVLDFLGKNTNSKVVPNSHTVFQKTVLKGKYENLIQHIACGMVHVVRHDMFEHKTCSKLSEKAPKVEFSEGTIYKEDICLDKIYSEPSARVLTRIRIELLDRIHKEFNYVKFSNSMVVDIKKEQLKLKLEKSTQGEDANIVSQNIPNLISVQSNELLFRRIIIKVVGDTLGPYTPLGVENTMISDVSNHIMVHFQGLADSGFTSCRKGFFDDTSAFERIGRKKPTELILKIARGMVHILVHEYLENSICENNKDIPLRQFGICNDPIFKPYNKKLLMNIQLTVKEFEVKLKLQLQKNAEDRANVETTIPTPAVSTPTTTLSTPTTSVSIATTPVSTTKKVDVNAKSEATLSPKGVSIMRKAEDKAQPKTTKAVSTMNKVDPLKSRNYSQALKNIVMGVIEEMKIMGFVTNEKIRFIMDISRTLGSFVQHLDDNFERKASTVYLNSLIKIIDKDLLNVKYSDIIKICRSILHVIIHNWFEHNRCVGISFKKTVGSNSKNPRSGISQDLLLCGNNIYSDKPLLHSIINHLTKAEGSFKNLHYKTNEDVTSKKPEIVQSVGKEKQTDLVQVEPSVPKLVTATELPPSPTSEEFSPTLRQIAQLTNPALWVDNQIPRCKNVVYLIPFIENYDDLNYEMVKELLRCITNFNNPSVFLDPTADRIILAIIKSVKCLMGKEKVDLSNLHFAHTNKEIIFFLKPDEQKNKEMVINLVRSEEIEARIAENAKKDLLESGDSPETEVIDDETSEIVDLTGIEDKAATKGPKIKVQIKLPLFEKLPTIAKQMETEPSISTSEQTKKETSSAILESNDSLKTVSADTSNDSCPIEKVEDADKLDTVIDLTESNDKHVTEKNKPKVVIKMPSFESLPLKGFKMTKNIESTSTKPTLEEATSSREQAHISFDVDKEKATGKNQSLNNSLETPEADASSQNTDCVPRRIRIGSLDYFFKMIGVDTTSFGYKRKRTNRILLKCFTNVLHIMNHEIIQNSECPNNKFDFYQSECHDVASTLCCIDPIYKPHLVTYADKIRKAIHECDAKIKIMLSEEKDLSKFSDLRQLTCPVNDKEVLRRIFYNIMGKLIDISSNDLGILTLNREIIEIMVEFVLTKFYERDVELDSQFEILFGPAKESIVCKRNSLMLHLQTESAMVLCTTGKAILHMMHHEMYLHSPCQVVEYWFLDSDKICSDSVYIKGTPECRDTIRNYLKEVEDQFINLRFQDHPTVKEYEAVGGSASCKTFTNIQLLPNPDENIGFSLQEVQDAVEPDLLNQVFHNVLGNIIADHAAPMYTAVKREIVEVMVEFALITFYNKDITREAQWEILFDLSRRRFTCKSDGTKITFKKGQIRTMQLRDCAKAVLHIMFHEMFLHYPCQRSSAGLGDPENICNDSVYRNWAVGMRDKIRGCLKEMEVHLVGLKFEDSSAKYEPLPSVAAEIAATDNEFTAERNLLKSIFLDILNKVKAAPEVNNNEYWVLHRELIEAMVEFVMTRFYDRNIECTSQPELLHCSPKGVIHCKGGTIIHFKKGYLRRLKTVAKSTLHVMHHEMYLHSPCDYNEEFPDPQYICSDDIYKQPEPNKDLLRIRSALRDWEHKFINLKFSTPKDNSTEIIEISDENEMKEQEETLYGTAPLYFVQEIGNAHFFMHIIQEVVKRMLGKKRVVRLPDFSFQLQTAGIVAKFVSTLGTDRAVQELAGIQPASTPAFYTRLGLAYPKKVEQPELQKFMDYLKVTRGLIHMITHEIYENSACQRRRNTLPLRDLREICRESLYKNRSLVKMIREVFKNHLVQQVKASKVPIIFDVEAWRRKADEPKLKKQTLENPDPKFSFVGAYENLSKESEFWRSKADEPKLKKQTLENPDPKFSFVDAYEKLSKEGPTEEVQLVSSNIREATVSSNKEISSSAIRQEARPTVKEKASPSIGEIVRSNVTEVISSIKEKASVEIREETRKKTTSDVDDKTASSIREKASSDVVAQASSNRKEETSSNSRKQDSPSAQISKGASNIKNEKLKIEAKQLVDEGKFLTVFGAYKYLLKIANSKEKATSNITKVTEGASNINTEGLKTEGKQLVPHSKEETTSNIKKKIRPIKHVSREAPNINTEELKIKAKQLVDQGKFLSVIKAYQHLVKNCFREHMQQKVLPKLTIKLRRMNLEKMQEKMNARFKKKMKPTHSDDLKVPSKKKSTPPPKYSRIQEGPSKKKASSVQKTLSDVNESDVKITPEKGVLKVMDVENKSEENQMTKDCDNIKKEQEVDLGSDNKFIGRLLVDDTPTEKTVAHLEGISKDSIVDDSVKSGKEDSKKEELVLESSSKDKLASNLSDICTEEVKSKSHILSEIKAKTEDVMKREKKVKEYKKLEGASKEKVEKLAKGEDEMKREKKEKECKKLEGTSKEKVEKLAKGELSDVTEQKPKEQPNVGNESEDKTVEEKEVLNLEECAKENVELLVLKEQSDVMEQQPKEQPNLQRESEDKVVDKEKEGLNLDKCSRENVEQLVIKAQLDVIGQEPKEQPNVQTESEDTAVDKENEVLNLEECSQEKNQRLAQEESLNITEEVATERPNVRNESEDETIDKEEKRLSLEECSKETEILVEEEPLNVTEAVATERPNVRNESEDETIDKEEKRLSLEECSKEAEILVEEEPLNVTKQEPKEQPNVTNELDNKTVDEGNKEEEEIINLGKMLETSKNVDESSLEIAHRKDSDSNRREEIKESLSLVIEGERDDAEEKSTKDDSGTSGLEEDGGKINLDDFDLFLLSSPEPEIRDSVSEIKPDFDPSSEDEDDNPPKQDESSNDEKLPEDDESLEAKKSSEDNESLEDEKLPINKE